MLVLARRVGQSLRISEDIRIVIVSNGGEVVKVGVDAPRDVPIYREELWQSVQEANLRSSRIKAEDFSIIREGLRVANLVQK